MLCASLVNHARRNALVSARAPSTKWFNVRRRAMTLFVCHFFFSIRLLSLVTIHQCRHSVVLLSTTISSARVLRVFKWKWIEATTHTNGVKIDECLFNGCTRRTTAKRQKQHSVAVQSKCQECEKRSEKSTPFRPKITCRRASNIFTLKTSKRVNKCERRKLHEFL